MNKNFLLYNDYKLITLFVRYQKSPHNQVMETIPYKL